MNKKEVEVLKAPVGQLLLCELLDMLLCVEGVPELGGDENILTLNDSLIDSPL